MKIRSSVQILPLAPGAYGPAMRYPFQEPTRAGLDVRADGRHCNTLIGDFVVHQIAYGPAGEIAHFFATFTQRCDGAGPALSGDVMFHADTGTAVLAAFVDADVRSDAARLVWAVQPNQLVGIERRTSQGSWGEVARTLADGQGRVVYDDRDVVPGGRYGYRLMILDAGAAVPLAEHWIDVPLRASFALGRPSPNPTQGEVGVSFELPDARHARVELIDVAGRRVLDLEVGSLGAGVHRVTLPLSARVPAGIYSIRLVRDGRSLVTPVCVTR